MNEIVKLREHIFTKINELLKHKALIFLWGKSGSGKSILLQRLAKQHKAVLINEIFTNEQDLKLCIEKAKEQGINIILLDEVGMYKHPLFEYIRIYSDTLSFVLSSHKKIALFKKEHFKSRFQAQIELKNLNETELKEYIKEKFMLELSHNNLSFLMKISKGNLRNIDKTLKSFLELSNYFQGNKNKKYIFKLSALENDLLR
ncbi:ATP-binding protein [Campylobacter sp. MIT 21-1685]|uniref:ATP-binding protein n=1 Tax=unclassified Campylobacter TaxID=2593542 RepID=UPI00224B2A57|nr:MULTISPECIES: ATP-binding protein [unclassified Campylobacter]MCX2683247.1 ATP-binding protein [Campylobacter sp. MIT 21-1684]MCX2751560.1 ATP-binding protein [Campylobacter sp. MIT 21-1682]MCX2807759.1 ATP-binding protein [Campylobacter sp. MIT 21-1685]